MLRLIFGVVVGGLAAWLYRSEETRNQVQDRLAAAPAPLRQGSGALAEAAATGAERAASLVDATPLPPRVKDRATATARSVAGLARRGGAGLAGQPQTAEQPLAALVENPVPEDVRAEQDAAARAAAEARNELQAGL